MAALALLLNSIWIIGVIAQASLIYVAAVRYSPFTLWFRSGALLRMLFLYFLYISRISRTYELWSAWHTKRRISRFSRRFHCVNLPLSPLTLLLKANTSWLRWHSISINGNFSIAMMILAWLLFVHPTLKVGVASSWHILSNWVIFTILISSLFRHIDSRWLWLLLDWFAKRILVLVKVSVLAHFVFEFQL